MKPGIPFVIYALALGVFLMGTTEFVVAGLLPQIAADMDVSVAQAGLSITVFAIGMILGSPLMALATLRISPRTTLVAALAVFALGHVLVALSSSFAIMLGARFLTAIATGAFWSVSTVVTLRTAPAHAVTRSVGIVNGGGMLATVLGVPLGAFAGQLVGWRGTFWGLAILALAALVLIWRQVPAGGAAPKGSVSIPRELSALRSVRLWLVLLASAGATGGTLAAYSYIAPILLDRTGIAEGLIPLVLAGFGVGSLVGSLVGGWIGDSRPFHALIIAPAVTIAILLVLCLAAGSALPTIVLVALLGLFGLGANPVLMAFAVRLGKHAPTLASALSVAAFNAGTAVGSWIGGRTLETELATNGPLLVGAAIAAIGLVAAVSLTVLLKGRAPAEDGAGAAG